MILIFGKTGQLARALRTTAPEGAEIAVLRREQVDVTDVNAIAVAIAAHRPSLVINATAHTAVDRAESESELAHAVNRDAPVAMAKAALAAGAKFATVSTDFVFDGTSSTPYPIDAPVAPLGVYGASKATGEAAVLSAMPDALIVRTAWVYDRDGRNFVNTMLRLMRERPELGVVGDQISSPTSATNLARAIWELTDAGASGIHHFTDAGIASWYDFAVAIQDIGLECGLLETRAVLKQLATRDYPTPAKRPAYSVLDKSATWPLLSTPPAHWRAALAEVLRSAAA